MHGSTWRPDPDVVMPANIQRRHHDLCDAARECYALHHAGHGDDYLAVGDVYAVRATALLGEWTLPILDPMGPWS